MFYSCCYINDNIYLYVWKSLCFITFFINIHIFIADFFVIFALKGNIFMEKRNSLRFNILKIIYKIIFIIDSILAPIFLVIGLVTTVQEIMARTILR